MRIIFFGSAEFAVPSLKALVNAGHEVALVVTQPDKPKGRGLAMGGTAVKLATCELGLKFFQPESVNSPDAIAGLRSLKPEVFVIIAYGQKFSREVLDIPSVMPINVHASLLPKYRGAAPINWAIINGEQETGTTVMKVIPKMDAGPIVMQSTVPIRSDDTAVRLEEILSRNSAELLTEALRRIEKGGVSLIEQDESRATFAPKLTREALRIDWRTNATAIHNLIRGVVNWSAAFTFHDWRMIKIHAASVFESSQTYQKPGEVLEAADHGIIVAAHKGSLRIEELQAEGKARLSCAEFLRGYPLAPGDMFEGFGKEKAGNSS